MVRKPGWFRGASRRYSRHDGWQLRLLIVGGCALVALLNHDLGRAFARHPVRSVRLHLSRAPKSLPVPVEGVSPAQLIDSWGAPRSGGRRHKGIDIFAPRRTRVLSATEGVVVRRGESRLGGRVVWVLGPGGQRHYYAHLDGWADVKAGKWLEAGTVLGYVGDSGNAKGTPPHLHYGVYPRGRAAVNPYPLLADR